MNSFADHSRRAASIVARCCTAAGLGEHENRAIAHTRSCGSVAFRSFMFHGLVSNDAPPHHAGSDCARALPIQTNRLAHNTTNRFMGILLGWCPSAYATTAPA